MCGSGGTASNLGALVGQSRDKHSRTGDYGLLLQPAISACCPATPVLRHTGALFIVGHAAHFVRWCTVTGTLIGLALIVVPVTLFMRKTQPGVIAPRIINILILKGNGGHNRD